MRRPIPKLGRPQSIQPIPPETELEETVELNDFPDPRPEVIPERTGTLPEWFANTPLQAWTVAVFVSIAWQVFKLGFYLDDWGFIVATARQGAAFSLERWQAAAISAPPRPGIWPFWYLLTSVLRSEPILWHLALLGANILLGVLLFRIARQLSDKPKDTLVSRGIYYSVLFWFILPWNATFHFWPTDVPIVLFLDLFAFCLLLTLQGFVGFAPALVIPFLGYLWGCVGYEAVYFQWFPIGLLGLTLVLAKRTSLKAVLIGVAPFLAAQACAVVWFTISLRLNPGKQNPIVPHWFSVFMGNLLGLPGQVLRSTQETQWPFIVAFAGWIAVLGITYGKALTASERRPAAWISVAQVAACLSGALISILAFSLGGRPVTGIGVDTRSFLLVNFWFVLAGALATSFCISRLAGRWLGALKTALIVGGCALAAGHLQRAFEWAEAWRLQQKILAEAPVLEMKNMEPDAVVLFVNTFDINGAPIFSAPWDINEAMPITHPTTRGHRFVVYNHWVGPLDWDGRQLAYANDVIETPQNLYVWQPLKREFWKAIAPFRVDENYIVHAR
jgi:hypothetical protein